MRFEIGESVEHVIMGHCVVTDSEHDGFYHVTPLSEDGYPLFQQAGRVKVSELSRIVKKNPEKLDKRTKMWYN